jgi:hypothetical protein
MATTIVTKNSSTASAVPTAGQLVQGELAVNVADKRLYTENNAGAVVELGTNPSTLTVTGEITANGGIALGDNDIATFGASDDLQIYHDGLNSYINDTGTGLLTLQGSEVRIKTTAGENMAIFNPNGSVQIQYDNATKFSTTSTGIDVTGNMESDSVTIGVGAVAGTEKLRVNGTVLTLGGTNSVPAIGIGDVNTGIYAPTTGTLGWTVNGTQRLFLNSTGIDVTGTVTADKVGITEGELEGNSGNLQLQSLSTGIIYDAANGFHTFRRNGTNALQINGSTGDISFYEDTGTTPKLFWDASAESLGIGTAPDAATVLHVQATEPQVLISDASSPLQRFMAFDVGLSADEDTHFITVDQADGLAFGEKLNGNDRVIENEWMRITNAGLVGIGTSSPDTLLHIVASAVAEMRYGAIGPSSNSALRISRNDSTTTSGNPLGYLEFGGNDATGAVDTSFAYVGAEASGTHAAGDNPTDLVFGTTADGSATVTERMRLDASGNLLVGKTAPALGTEGIEARATGFIRATVDSADCLQLNRLSIDGDIIDFRKDGTAVGSIGTYVNLPYIGKDDVNLLFDPTGPHIIPRGTAGGARDAAINLGFIN